MSSATLWQEVLPIDSLASFQITYFMSNPLPVLLVELEQHAVSVMVTVAAGRIG